MICTAHDYGCHYVSIIATIKLSHDMTVWGTAQPISAKTTPSGSAKVAGRKHSHWMPLVWPIWVPDVCWESYRTSNYMTTCCFESKDMLHLLLKTELGLPRVSCFGPGYHYEVQWIMVRRESDVHITISFPISLFRFLYSTLWIYIHIMLTESYRSYRYTVNHCDIFVYFLTVVYYVVCFALNKTPASGVSGDVVLGSTKEECCERLECASYTCSNPVSRLSLWWRCLHLLFSTGFFGCSNPKNTEQYISILKLLYCSFLRVCFVFGLGWLGWHKLTLQIFLNR